MASLIENNYQLLPVISRFGISLGFKDKTVREICEKEKINMEFFLAIVNTYNNNEFYVEKELVNFQASLIIDYLEKTHQYYLNFIIPKLDSLLDKVIKSAFTSTEELILLERFYREYRDELIIHIRDEEEKFFPLILKKCSTKMKSGASSHLSFDFEHTNVEMKINDIKNLLIRYIRPVYDVNLCNDFFIALLQFEEDIANHTRIEDRILISMNNAH